MEIVHRMANRYFYAAATQYESIQLININDINSLTVNSYAKMHLNRINDSLYKIYKEVYHPCQALESNTEENEEEF